MEVLIVQSDLIWESPEANRSKLGGLLSGRKIDADLAVLPEMFTTGFSMNSENLAEQMDGVSVAWMRNLAISEGMALAGSLIIEENGRYYNRLLFVDEKGSITAYDKGHLFRMEKENNFFSKGLARAMVDYNGFSINLQICYDLRFPVWSRNVDNNYDILLYVANWPESRRHVWNTLLVARAIENQCYVIGVNRVGTDGTGIKYSGDSVIIDPKGNIIAEVEPYSEGLASASLSIKDITDFREKFPVWRDADRFDLL